MIQSAKKFNIKIPRDVKAIYSKRKRTLILMGPLTTKSKTLKVQIFINNEKKIISVSPILFVHSSNTEKKKNRLQQSTTVSQIKFMLIESSVLCNKKLKIIGVGYRAHFTEKFNQTLITFKLGYSHFIYVQALNNITLKCLTKTKLCISGDSYESVSHLSARIRKNKTPEPYKGKGILLAGEVVEIKEGKKV